MIDESGPTQPAEVLPDVVEDTAANNFQELSKAVSEPSKLMRIASMTRAMLEEARTADVDERGRKRLHAIYQRAVEEICEVVSEDLREELTQVFVPFADGIPSESEIRIAQAQLVGWLEGLFNGIQAAVMTQQLMAQAQFRQIQRRALQPGTPEERPGVYL
ncbi:MAG: proteasome activator [Acidimicrobiia bacterium]